jgi:hypothetical protein
LHPVIIALLAGCIGAPCCFGEFVKGERLSELLAVLSQETIPPVPEFRMGCDGFHRELAFGGYAGGVKYRWWVEPPVGWEKLGELAREAHRLANLNGALKRSKKARSS